MARSPPLDPSTTQPDPFTHSPTRTSTAANRKTSTTLHTSTNTVPLNDPARTTTLHPFLPSILVPAETANTSLNPLTLQPFTAEELKSYNFDKVQSDYASASKAEIERARDEAAKRLKEKIEEREAKVREVDKEVEEKEKIREVERKVYRKKMEARGKGSDE